MYSFGWLFCSSSFSVPFFFDFCVSLTVFSVTQTDSILDNTTSRQKGDKIGESNKNVRRPKSYNFSSTSYVQNQTWRLEVGFVHRIRVQSAGKK